MIEYLKSLTQMAEIGQSRSSITNPLQWVMVILLGGTFVSIVVRAPAWIAEILIGGLILVIALFAYAFLFFMHTQPEVLRSEQYHLSKMAIERGMVGDSIHGLVKADLLPPSDVKTLTSGQTAEESE